MSRRKQNKRKYAVVRTAVQGSSRMDKKTQKAIAAAALALGSLLAKGGLDMIPAPPSVGFILVGAALALGWFAVIHSGWFDLLAKRRVQYAGYAVTGIVTLVLALCVRGGKSGVPRDTSQAIVTPPSVAPTVQSSQGANVIAIGEANNVTINQSADHESTQSIEEEKISIELQGGVVCDDYGTRFHVIPSLAGPKKTVIVTRWPIIVSNNSLATISLTAYQAVSRIYGNKRNIETRLLNSEGLPTSLPVNVKGGESTKLFLVLPVHIIDSVYDLVRNVPDFSDSFTPQALDTYLKKNHGMDLYGNKYRYPTGVTGEQSWRFGVHVFGYNDDGTLSTNAMQTDQVTITFRTAMGHYFSARALYYEGRRDKPPHVLPPMPRGKPATIELEFEPIDSLPRDTQGY